MGGQNWKIPILHLVAGAANVPLLIVLKRIQLQAVDDTGWRATARDVERMRGLRRSMQAATGSLGVVIALAVIATGALRQATVAAGLTPVPDTFVLATAAGSQASSPPSTCMCSARSRHADAGCSARPPRCRTPTLNPRRRS